MKTFFAIIFIALFSLNVAHGDDIIICDIDNTAYTPLEVSASEIGHAPMVRESQIMAEAKRRLKEEEKDRPVREMMELLKEEKRLKALLDEVKYRIGSLQFENQ